MTTLPGPTGDDEPVEIVAYDVSWPRIFAVEAAQIAAALEDACLGIEHIGSTAVEGLAAKPVIDIQVGVRSLQDTTRIVEAMQRLGYQYVAEFEAEFRNRRYFRRTVNGRRSHQVHVVERTDAGWWDRHVVFRDWLRRHPEDVAAYAALKRNLATTHRDDRRAYTDAKTEFIETIVRRASKGPSA